MIYIALVFSTILCVYMCILIDLTTLCLGFAWVSFNKCNIFWSSEWMS